MLSLMGRKGTGRSKPLARLAWLTCSPCLCLLVVRTAYAQVESVEGPPPPVAWVSSGKVEGHLALNYSPDAAFSPDGSKLAVASEGKVLLMNLAQARPERVLKPHLPNVTDLQIQSANFISPTRLFILASGLLQTKGAKGSPPRTPELGFQWYIDQDQLYDKIEAVGAGGGFAPPRYFPEIAYLGLYKNSNFDFWSPNSGRGARLTIPDLTHQPNLYAPSPDGHWMLLAQIETSGSPDPLVVRLSERKFVDTLAGHQGVVLCIKFSRDGRRVLTTCEDGKVRVYSVGEWKLLHTLSGHRGPVHWAEFSANGQWIASAGEDHTLRIWSAEDGNPLQTLSESQSPLLTVAFSPNDEFIAASAEQSVLVWKRTAGAR
jgi:WD40 repeat protein